MANEERHGDISERDTFGTGGDRSSRLAEVLDKIGNYIESTLGPAAQLLWYSPSVHWEDVVILIVTKELTGRWLGMIFWAERMLGRRGVESEEPPVRCKAKAARKAQR